MIRVLVYPIGAKPYAAFIDETDTLKGLQAIVGGLIEPIDLACDDKGTVSIYCNEESEILGLPMNRLVGQYLLRGELVLSRIDKDGETCSITDDDIKRFSDFPAFLLGGTGESID